MNEDALFYEIEKTRKALESIARTLDKLRHDGLLIYIHK